VTVAADVEIRPQPGPQEVFLSSPADIAVYGGAAGGGKTWALLLEPLRHMANADFGAVIFRRTSPQIRNEGGLWDESSKLYPLLGAEPKESILEWGFPSGATIRFAHLEHEKNKHDWQGAQVPFLGFDELTHFSEDQFFYMLSRNRSMCGVRPYVRATTNPDADSWLASFLAWWIDPETGYPISERAGVVRWFVRVNGEIRWGDTAAELLALYPDNPPKSVAFVPASVHDNRKLLEANPEYLGNLKAQALVEQERLLKGNWKIRAEAGLVFNRAWFEIVEAFPAGSGLQWCRFWDKAATAGGGDWTAGVLMCRTPAGLYYVVDVVRGQWNAGERERVIKQTTQSDRERFHRVVRVRVEQEPGSGGKESAELTVKALDGFDVRAVKSTGDKVERAQPFAAQAQVGNVKLVRGSWNEPYLRELHAFPTKGIPDDQVDGSSGAHNDLARPQTSSIPPSISRVTLR
jgi:predicted phage terminase large subunit-like protein